MGELVGFPGVAEVSEVTKPELDPDEIIAQQNDLLARWRVLGEELTRRAEHPLPFDLALELRDLIDETDA